MSAAVVVRCPRCNKPFTIPADIARVEYEERDAGSINFDQLVVTFAVQEIAHSCRRDGRLPRRKESGS